MQVFEETEDWRLLSKAWINFCRQEVVHSAVRAVHTPEGQRLQNNILRDCVVGNEFPILVAWDQLNNKVSFLYIISPDIRNIIEHNFQLKNCLILIHIVSKAEFFIAWLCYMRCVPCMILLWVQCVVSLQNTLIVQQSHAGSFSILRSFYKINT